MIEATAFKRTMIKVMLVLIIILTLIDIVLIVKYRDDNKYLLNLSGQIVSSQDIPSEKTIKFMKYIREEVPDKRNTSFFLLPVLRFLRPTARQAAENGGDCADSSRLLIRLLRLNNIQASKVALYDKQQAPQHAVVQVNIENNQKMVVDPYFGIYFPKKNAGKYYSLDDIKNTESILHDRVTALVDQGEQHRPLLSRYPFAQYTYAQPRTINWDKSFLLKIIYQITKFFIGERVDEIKRPYFVESPALMLLYAVLSLQVIIVIGTWLFPKTWKLGRKLFHNRTIGPA